MTSLPSQIQGLPGAPGHISPFWEGEAEAGSGQAVLTVPSSEAWSKAPSSQGCGLWALRGPRGACFCRSVSSKLMGRQPSHKDEHRGGGRGAGRGRGQAPPRPACNLAGKDRQAGPPKSDA